MKEFAPDGGCVEGPGYWSYATCYTAFYLAAHPDRARHRLRPPGIARASPRPGMFRIHTVGPLNRTFNFADAGDSVGRRVADVLPRPRVRPAGLRGARADAARRSGRRSTPFHLLWFQGGGDDELAKLPTAGVLPPRRGRDVPQRVGRPERRVRRLQGRRQRRDRTRTSTSAASSTTPTASAGHATSARTITTCPATSASSAGRTTACAPRARTRSRSTGRTRTSRARRRSSRSAAGRADVRRRGLERRLRGPGDARRCAAWS